MDKQDILRLCRDCAASIYGTAPPSPQYAERVAKLLFMTAAHESLAFRFRRQIGFRRETCTGAFGLWQCELASIEASIDLIHRPDRRPLRDRCLAWLDRWPGLEDVDLSHRTLGIALLALQEPRGDPLSCLLARLHYLRVPEAVPATVQDMAVYAKRYYNTRLGKATASDYLRAYERWWK